MTDATQDGVVAGPGGGRPGAGGGVLRGAGPVSLRGKAAVYAAVVLGLATALAMLAVVGELARAFRGQ